MGATGGSVTLFLPRPLDYGGLPLASYTLQRAPGLTGFASVPTTLVAASPAGHTVTVTGLAASTIHFFRVAAVTAAGQGPFSILSAPVRTGGASVPVAPLQPQPLANLTSSGGLAAWVPPADAGGVLIVEYRVAVQATAPQSSLFHSQTYTVSVLALR